MRPVVHEVIESTGRPWRVACVCDPVGGPGAGFGVTVGLAPLGLPELLLPARPPWQEVTAGWRLSHRDLATLLDDLGEQLLCGDLWGFGYEADVDGTATARLVPAAPVPLAALTEALPVVLPGLPPDRLEAAGRVVHDLVRPAPQPIPRPASLSGTGEGAGDGAGDGATAAVCVVPWAVEPGPVAMAAILAAGGGPAPGLLAVEVAAVRARTAALRGEVLDRGGRPGHVPARWRPAPGRLPARPRPPGQGPAARFGPRHELVLARAEQVLVCDAALLTAFLTLAAQVGAAPPAEVLGRVDGLATSTGRPGLPAELALAADDVTTLLTGRGGHTTRWRQARAALSPRGAPTGGVTAADQHSRELLRRHLHALLAAEAFSDVLAPAALICGRLSWVAALVALAPGAGRQP